MIFKYKQNIMKGRKTFMGKIDVATKQYMSHKNVIAEIGEMNTEIKNAIIAADDKTQYDIYAKRLLAQKSILANITKAIYLLCVFSMVIPFQMVMFTLSGTADSLGLNTPWGLLIIYLGFGAGLAVFMFCGFVKSIPIEVEEAAMIDGCSPIRTFFSVVVPMMKPTLISVGILEAMWIWNDFLLPYLTLDIKKYKTISIIIQYMKGSYGRVDMGAIMACLIMAVIPVIVFYLCCQKYIIKGVAAGAVKG